MPNFEAQACGLIIVCLVIYLFSRHRRVGLKREKLFVKILALTFVLECVDILSLFAIRYQDVFSTTVSIIICKVYVALLISESLCGVVYLSSKLFSGKKARLVRNLITVIHTAGILLIMVLPIHMYDDGKNIYTYGPSVMLAYVFFVTYVVFAVVLSYIPSIKVTISHRMAVRAWMAAWVISALIQMLYPEILLTAFASAFGLLVLFCALENPESNINRTTRAFTSQVCIEYIKERYESNKKFSMLTIVLEESIKTHLNPTRERVAVFEISEFLRSLGEFRVFYNTNNDFHIIFEKEDELRETYKKIKERFLKPWEGLSEEEEILLEPVYMLLEDSSIFQNESEQFFFFHKLKHHNDDKEIKEYHINEETIEEINNFEVMRMEIKDALLEDRIEAFYQPIYSIKTGAFTAAEALVRIRKADGSMIPPGLFIPVAEETGLIQQIDERVFEKTCKMLSDDGIDKLGVHYIELNVSVVQCENPKLAAKYIDIIDKYGVDTSHINLEVTESANIKQRDVLLENMHLLMKKGINFSLDDFGTGESNLNYIIDMPVTIVKFDMSMTQSYFTNEKTKVVMRNSINMIKELGYKVVLEGVETKEQMDELCKMAVDYIQGYYFSKPLSKSEYIEFLKEKNR